MATNPALVARTTLVAEEPWKAVLRRTLQAVAGAPDRDAARFRARSTSHAGAAHSSCLTRALLRQSKQHVG